MVLKNEKKLIDPEKVNQSTNSAFGRNYLNIGYAPYLAGTMTFHVGVGVGVGVGQIANIIESFEYLQP